MQEIMRHEAVLFTSLLGKQTPFDFLVAASRDRDEEGQILVCIALGALADWANPEWLIPLVNSGDQEVRSQAGDALIPYGDRIPLEPVLHALLKRGADYEDPCVVALGALKEKFPRERLEQLVNSDGTYDREVAALIIGNMGEAAPIDLLATLLAMPYSEETHVARLNALEAAQKLKAPQLARQLAELTREEPRNESEWQRNNNIMRFSAAAALGALGDPRYLAEILQLFVIINLINYMDMSNALAGYGEQMPVNELITFILAQPADDSDDVADLIRAFQHAGKQTPYPFLLADVQDERHGGTARGAAAITQATFSASVFATVEQRAATLRLLTESLSHPTAGENDAWFRHMVGYALGVTKEPAALEPLMTAALLQGSEGHIAMGAAQGLYLLARQGIHAPLEFWRRVLEESADMRRKYAILALGTREDAPSELLLRYFGDKHLKELVFAALLKHPPTNAHELAQERLTELAATENDPLAPAAQAALKRML
jgi:HEAT repeat protein